MKRFLRCGLQLALLSAGLTAGVHAAESKPGLSWLTNLHAAETRAKAEHKSILLFFHGSDWCPSCLEMQRQVFESAEFIEYALQVLILVDVDFPQQHPQDLRQRQANLELKTKFNLSPEPGEGFPTIVLLNETGQTLFQETGYGGSGPREVLISLQRHTGTGGPSAHTAGFKNLSVDEFAALATDKSNIVLDVRTSREYAAGHIPGAMNLDVLAADFDSKANALDKNKTYLVHCASGVRSVRACEKLARLDFPNLYNLPGGFRAWEKADRPVEK